MGDKDADYNMLPSNLFYYNLEKKVDICSYNDSQYWRAIMIQLNTHEGITQISDHLKIAFCYVSYMRNNMLQYEERWNYLFYWTGVKILENLKILSNFYKAMGILNSVKVKFDSNKDYDDDFFEINEEEFNNLKKVYDYAQNYHDLETKTKNNYFKCSKKYDEYIKESVQHFKSQKTKCENDLSPYCKIFNKMFITYKMQTFLDFVCREVEPEIVAKEEYRGALGVPGSFNGLQAQTFQTGYSSRTNVLPGSEFQLEPALTPKSSPIDPMVITFPVFGILLTLFILYKFTPLGPWVHSHLLRKNNILREEIDEEDHELLQDEYTYRNENFHGNRHNMGYHPS
ncbi:PIR Superfamily Protein [Plasmodium ovale wallikeri]|uniref:PIR protein n=2 Tax=Plasmodium ovale TaxID=36330 RepID=A0A1C3KGD1_PLAOA|nr:PIR Superfamily Protein [Plasmodium ovale wallikeri]SBT72757.1 PIR protein [Plasmodium ovale]